MKKIISIILIIIMATAMTAPTFALSSGTDPKYDNVCSDPEGVEVPVEYGVANGFELLIPAVIGFNDDNIGEGKYVSCTIAAINVVIENDRQLKVTIFSQSDKNNTGTVWQLKVPETDANKQNGTFYNEEVDYTVAKDKGGTPLKNGDTVLTVASLAKDLAGYQNLHCNTLGSNQSGTYVDYLTFVAQVVNAN